MIARQLKVLRARDEKLNKDLMQAQHNLASTTTRYRNSRKDEQYKKKGQSWIANWNCLPGALMAKYQDSKDWCLVCINQFDYCLDSISMESIHRL